jgi:hypothetical protein
VGWWVKGREFDDLAIMQAQMLEKSKARFEQRLTQDLTAYNMVREATV